jgi:hypothetical protein
MPLRAKYWTILVAVGFVALLAFIIYSSTGLARVNCEVCVEFHGRTSCQTAAGTNQNEAYQTAASIACSDLASGRTEGIACQNTPAKSVSCK